MKYFFSVFLFLCIFFVCNYAIVIFLIRKNWNFVEFSLILLMRYCITLLVHFKVINSSFYEDNFYIFLYIIFKTGCHWLQFSINVSPLCFCTAIILMDQIFPSNLKIAVFFIVIFGVCVFSVFGFGIFQYMLCKWIIIV